MALQRTLSNTALKSGKPGHVAKEEGIVLNGPAKDYANLPLLRLKDDRAQGNIKDAVIDPPTEKNWRKFLRGYTKTKQQFDRETFEAGHNYIFVVLPKKYNLLKRDAEEIRYFDENTDGGIDAGHSSLLTPAEWEEAENLSRSKEKDTGVVLWGGTFEGGDKKYAPFNIAKWTIRSGHWRPPLMNAEVFGNHWGFPKKLLDDKAHNAYQPISNIYDGYQQQSFLHFNVKMPSLQNQHSTYLYASNMDFVNGYGDGISINNFDNQLFALNVVFVVILVLLIFCLCMMIGCVCGGIFASYVGKKTMTGDKNKYHQVNNDGNEVDIESKV